MLWFSFALCLMSNSSLVVDHILLGKLESNGHPLSRLLKLYCSFLSSVSFQATFKPQRLVKICPLLKLTCLKTPHPLKVPSQNIASTSLATQVLRKNDVQTQRYFHYSQLLKQLLASQVTLCFLNPLAFLVKQNRASSQPLTLQGLLYL